MANNIIGSLGAGSGIDVQGLVKGLTSAERAPQASRLDSREQKLETQISAYGVLKSSLSEFQSMLSPLADADTFNARSVAFPETDLITPTELKANAQAGSYQIEVLSVAQSQSLASAAVDDPKAALGGGNITLRFGEWDSYTEGAGPVGFTQNGDKDALDLTLDADDSLYDLVDKINESDTGLQASVVQTDGKYQLLLTSESGAKQAVEITADANLSQFEFKEGSTAMLQTQAGVDASMKVNGLSVTRQTNDIDDVIQGLSFTLNKAEVGEKVSFSISEDKASGEQAIRDFVEGYNALYETMKNLTGVRVADPDSEDPSKVAAGALSTDGTAKSLLSRLRTMMTAAVPGLEDSGISALTNLGIRTQIDGTLEIVEDDFRSAIDNNFDDVASFFAPQNSVSNSAIQVEYGSYVGEALPGNYEVNITTEPAKGSLSGDPVTAGFPLNTGAGGQYSFKVSVDGTSTQTITLPDNKDYASADEVAVELQALINGDDAISGGRVGVDVAFNATDNRFEFISREFGASSSVKFTEASASMADLGITTALTGTKGRDVAGSIAGEPAFGAGNVLLPAVGSDAYGLNLTVGAGSLGTSTLTYTRGLAGEMSNLVESLLSKQGTISNRQENMNDQLEGIESDREELDLRMEKYEARITSQFLAMERIVSGFQTAGNSLDGMLANLPFTAQYA